MEMKLWLSLQAVAVQACANILMHLYPQENRAAEGLTPLAGSHCLRQCFKKHCGRLLLSPLESCVYPFGDTVHRQTDPGHG